MWTADCGLHDDKGPKVLRIGEMGREREQKLR